MTAPNTPNISRLRSITPASNQPTPHAPSALRKAFGSCLLALLAWTVGLPATAADLKDVFEAAKANDAVIGAARAQYEAARQALPQARSGLLPQVSAQGTTSWNELSFPVGPQFNPDTGLFEEVPDQQYNDHGWSATLNQPIVNFSAWFTYTSAKAAVERAKTSLDAAEQNLIVRATEAYLNVLRAQDLLDSTQAAEAAVKRQLEQVQQRFDVGLVAITDVLEAQAAYDDALVNRIQADGDHDIFFENLRTLTGTAYDSLNRLSEELPIVNPAPANEEEWVQTALNTNYGVKGAQHAVAAAARTLRSRRSDHLPTLGASALRNHDVTGGPSFLGGKTDVTRYSLTLNVPIFSGGLVQSRARQASAELEGARQQLLDSQRTVARDTRNLFRSVATDVVRVRARQRAIESSQSALDATETGYEVGTRNIVDVLQAQQRLFGSQFDYADSRYRYVLDLMRLKQSTGTLIDEDLVELNKFTDPNDQVKTLPSLRRYSGDLGS